MNKNKKMPVIFTGHGSPLNAIGNNSYRTEWKKIGKYLPKPKVIIAISAHWFKDKTFVRTKDNNPQINDMYGFPKELYEVHYEPEGSPEYAQKVLELLDEAEENNEWGIDHGIWSVLSNIYPEADIPVVMISVNVSQSPQKQYEIGQKLAPLREEGALILGSGNVVHNLMKIDWNMNKGYQWAQIFDEDIKQYIIEGNFEKIINYETIKFNKEAIPTVDHFYPLLSILGAADTTDNVKIFNEKCELGSMSMTSYIFEE